jgi:hypothetical protein
MTGQRSDHQVHENEQVKLLIRMGRVGGVAQKQKKNKKKKTKTNQIAANDLRERRKGQRGKTARDMKFQASLGPAYTNLPGQNAKVRRALYGWAGLWWMWESQYTSKAARS